MVLNLVRKTGVPALAYSVNDPSLRSCVLKILHLDDEFVVSLEHQFGDEELAIFRYEGSNLVLKKNSLRPIDICLSAGTLGGLAREGPPLAQTLSLTLKAPCSVWYPRSLGDRVYHTHIRFRELLTFARATEVRIVFDTNWLGKNRAKLQSAVESHRPLRGIPSIAEFTRDYQLSDWSTFEDSACEVLPSIETVAHDPPPAYDSSSKRPRRSPTSLTPDISLPQSKRFLHDPTSAPSLIKRAASDSTVLSTATEEVDLFQLSVTAAVEKVLPEVLLQLLARHPHSPSLSPTPCSSQITNAPTDLPSHKSTFMSGLGAIIKTEIEAKFEGVLDEAAHQTNRINDVAANDFQESLEAARGDLASYKEDLSVDLNDKCNEKLERFTQRVKEVKDGAAAELDELAETAVLKTIDELSAAKSKACCRCKCHSGAEDTRSESEQGRRAKSLPVLKSKESGY